MLGTVQAMVVVLLGHGLSICLCKVTSPSSSSPPPSWRSPTWYSGSPSRQWRTPRYRRFKPRSSSILPSMLLSGFLFPFSGMPRWAQLLGQALPLTHFVRAMRGLLLRGDGLVTVAHEMWPVAVFTGLAATLAASQYRRHLV